MTRAKITHLVGPGAAAVTALVLLTPGMAAAQAAWTAVPSPAGGQLNGVATVSANDVWAVGQTLAPLTLAEHWKGHKWKVVPAPNPATNDRLSAVAAVSTSDVWAVGIVSFSAPPVILHWNGKRWASVAPPTQTGFLSGAAAVSTNDVWAVGESMIPGVGLQTLIEHWGRRQLDRCAQPNVGPMDQLRAVTAVSATDVWAVRFAEPTSVSNPQTLVLHWDGASWTVVPSPNPAGAQDNELSGVTAVSATDVWAVGETGNGAQTTTEHWGRRQLDRDRQPLTRPARGWSRHLDQQDVGGRLCHRHQWHHLDRDRTLERHQLEHRVQPQPQRERKRPGRGVSGPCFHPGLGGRGVLQQHNLHPPDTHRIQPVNPSVPEPRATSQASGVDTRSHQIRAGSGSRGG